MKRVLTAAICAAAAIAMAQPASAHGELKRQETGSILLPVVQDTSGDVLAPPGLVTRHVRCAYALGRDSEGLFTGEDTNGVFGHVVALDEAEQDGEHTFTLTSDKGDVAAIFYASMAACDADASTTGDAVTEGDEEGTIPLNTTHIAIVYTGAEVDVAFDLKIFEPEEDDA